MRILVISAIGLLSACAEPQPSAAQLELQKHCEAGNAQACAYILQAEEQQRQSQIATSQALLNMSAVVQQQSTPAPRMQTTCVRQGVFLNCF